MAKEVPGHLAMPKRIWHMAEQLKNALTKKDEKRFIRLKEVKTRVSLSRSSVYDLMARGKFPGSHKLGERSVGWLASDIESWIDSRVAASGTK